MTKKSKELKELDEEILELEQKLKNYHRRMCIYKTKYGKTFINLQKKRKEATKLVIQLSESLEGY